MKYLVLLIGMLFFSMPAFAQRALPVSGSAGAETDVWYDGSCYWAKNRAARKIVVRLGPYVQLLNPGQSWKFIGLDYRCFSTFFGETTANYESPMPAPPSRQGGERPASSPESLVIKETPSSRNKFATRWNERGLHKDMQGPGGDLFRQIFPLTDPRPKLIYVKICNVPIFVYMLWVVEDWLYGPEALSVDPNTAVPEPPQIRHFGMEKSSTVARVPFVTHYGIASSRSRYAYAFIRTDQRTLVGGDGPPIITDDDLDDDVIHTTSQQMRDRYGLPAELRLSRILMTYVQPDNYWLLDPQCPR